ncbi:MAG: cation:proton antiporter, partial [Candidatus Aenigmarchaeota archaeon]|nr:cation:proton antiporter [Candidatus Aenigmarchaeota archaeon]
LGGVVQMGLTFLLGLGISIIAGLEFIVGIYMGLLLAFSSTMIVAKLLVDRNEIKTLHGRIMMGVLLIQDLLVILILPILASMNLAAGLGMLSPDGIAIIIVEGMGLFSIAVVLNKYVLKRILD